MRKMTRVALVMGLMVASTASAEAREVHSPDDEATTQVFVMNNYLTEVRVYIEDDEGRLHHMARLSRGALAEFSVPAELARGEFRVKVFPDAMPGSALDGGVGIKTNPLRAERDQQVRVWVEADLPSSIVEIARD